MIERPSSLADFSIWSFNSWGMRRLNWGSERAMDNTF
nr:MAG TPA: Insect kinin peptide [Caudoviricetes sp.]